MLNLKYIDDKLFVLLHNTFINLFKNTRIKDIKYFILHRNTILRKMIILAKGTPRKVNTIKK